MTERNDRTTWRLFDIFISALIAMNAGLLGFAGKILFSVHSRIVAVEHSTMKATEGLELWQEIGELKQQIANRPTRQETPPVPFVARVERLERLTDEHLAKHRKHD